MTVLLFVAIFAVIGGLLYLPFFLWFRRHRPSEGRTLSARVSYTPAGWLLFGVLLIAMFAGIALRERLVQGTLGSLLQGELGLLKWWVLIFVVFSAVGALLRGAGIELERPEAADTAGATSEEDNKRVRATSVTARRYHVATIGGVPVFVQRSYLYGGFFIGLVAQAGVAGIAGYCVAYALLFALHEAGHVIAARALRLHVYAVELSAIGGSCTMHVPRRPRDVLLVYSAGLVAQILLLGFTLAITALTSPTDSPFGRGVVATFTWINGLIFLINLMPGHTPRGIPTDGTVLWRLLLHRFRGAPHPFAAQLARSPVFEPSTSLLAITELVPEGFSHGVEILNDDTTPMQFVIDMLQRHLGLAPDVAAKAMLDIHRRGGLLLPLASREAADEAAGAIARDTQAQSLRLVCRAVSANA
jgi:ATP-dependent Clp protease adapter protein ClpS